jgi:hypothetical protein
VPVSEIDRDATAAAVAARRKSSARPSGAGSSEASTPAEVARTTKDVPKAKVRITDADVSHPLDMGDSSDAKAEKKEAAPGDPRVEVVDYSQAKSGGTLTVKGTVRNPGQGTAENVRLQVTAVDEKAQVIDGANATLSKGSVDSGTTVDFTASLNVGDKSVVSLRFNPLWNFTPRATPAASPAQTGGATKPAATGANTVGSAANAARAATPVPTPYGRGNLYAAPPANAPSEAPADGKTGYIPGASHPDNQPKPPGS